MKQYKVKYNEDFYKDLQSIINHIIDVTSSEDIARRFYNDTISAIERRSFSAESFERYIPFKGSEVYYRIYFGNYIIFYVVDGGTMDVRRMLWSGVNKPRYF